MVQPPVLGSTVGTAGRPVWPLMRWQHAPSRRASPGSDRACRRPCRAGYGGLVASPGDCLSQGRGGSRGRGAMRRTLRRCSHLDIGTDRSARRSRPGHQAGRHVPTIDGPRRRSPNRCRLPRFQEKAAIGQRLVRVARSVWLKRHEPQAWDRARYVAACGGLVVARPHRVLDHGPEQPLKTGLDLVACPAVVIEADLGIDLALLPARVMSGQNRYRLRPCATPPACPWRRSWSLDDRWLRRAGASGRLRWRLEYRGGSPWCSKALPTSVPDPEGVSTAIVIPPGGGCLVGPSNVGAQALTCIPGADRTALDRAALAIAQPTSGLYPLPNRRSDSHQRPGHGGVSHR